MRLAVVLLLVLLLLLSGPRLAAAGRSAKGPVSAYAVDGAAVELAGAPGSGGSSFPADPLLPCMAELLPCTAYLRSGRNPSRTCCTAMHDGAVDEMQCLCRLLADPELLHTFNVTRDQMFRLPARCGLPVGCRAGAAGSPEPVVDAPPPPGDTDQQPPGDPSSGDRSRSSTAAVVLAGATSVAALFRFF
ncbi:non-specific lipid transfer protein GPI-anchored 3-like isoform X2 [Oryza brachyantha]|uniref:non-specific lipid transfer protein GPI-anchored 3-like isoform X2 n=1 Tax=Oryza brachyantha TaxID=4533 RepID=UPI001ADA0406|nr:non-specific lipid transfer protein GPI-anchored 3-like isoform X2 [Oryza brachyantha]